MLVDVQHAIEALPFDEPLVVLADFDGTLAEFNANPAAPMLTDVRREWLRDIAAQPDTFVGIVSGRDIANLRRHVQLDHIGYAGNHGLEIELPGERFEYPTAAAARPVLARITAALAAGLRPYPGAWVQDKGLSLTVHYRRAAVAHHDAVTAAVQSAFDAVTAGQEHNLTAPRLALRPGNRWGLEMGGHWRTGLEDNVRWDKHRLAASNAELVKRVADLCGEYNRVVATPDVAREILKLQ